MVEGPTDRALVACREAVELARASLSVTGGGPVDRRRLARRLWRFGSVLAERGDFRAALVPAREAVGLARETLRLVPPDHPDADAAAGEFGTYANTLTQVLQRTGRAGEAHRLAEEAHEATSGTGPLALRARAGMQLLAVQRSVVELSHRVQGKHSSTVDARSAVAAAGATVALLRRIATADDPGTWSDLAEGLRALGLLRALVHEGQAAADALSEAYSIISGFDDPASQQRATALLAELKQLAAAFPRVRIRLSTQRRPGPQTRSVLPILPIAGFTRARAALGSDAAGGVDHPETARELAERYRRWGDEPSTADAEERLLLLTAGGMGDTAVNAAAATVERRRRLAIRAPHPHGAILGLTVAMQAHIQLRYGRSEAAETADTAATLLRRHGDEPDRVQPALILALDALALAELAAGRYESAERALRHAVDVLDQLSTQDGRYGPELNTRRALLAPGAVSLIVGEHVRGPYADLDAGIRLVRTGRLADAEPVLDRAAGRFLLAWPDESTDPARPGAADRSVWGRELRRRTAIAFWQHSLCLYGLGRLEDSLRQGRTGVGIGGRLWESWPGGSDRAELTAESATALVDLAGVAFTAGRVDEGFDLLDQAVRRCGNDPHRDVRRALGTALHQLTNAALTAVVRGRQPAGRPRYTMAEVLDLASRAVAHRESLVEPLAAWELASSLLLHSHAALLNHRPRIGIERLYRAMSLTRPLGPAGAALFQQANGIAAMASEVAPEEVRSAQAAGLWPF